MFGRVASLLLMSIMICGLPAATSAQTFRPAGNRVDLSKLKAMTWTVDDTRREALVYLPANPEQHPPLIFAFHGHGGTEQFAARKFDYHDLWPEAICVYPQGLNTATGKVDPEGKMPGWQKAIGDQNDRDLAFFDAMLKTMKDDYHIDDNRVYASGHSNGGFFTYVLWAARGDELAAVAPISAFLNLQDIKKLKPKPVFHVAGEKDPMVKFSFQEAMMAKDRSIDGCAPDGAPAGQWCTKYTSPNGPTVITFIHPGGHEVPQGATQRIIEFFKEQSRR